MIEFERYDPETVLPASKTVIYDVKLIKAIEEADYGCNILIGKKWVASIEDYQIMKAKRDGKNYLVFNPFNSNLSSSDMADIGQILYKTYRKGNNKGNN